MESPVSQVTPSLRRLVSDWAVHWNLPGLERDLDIAFSGRFRTSLGRCTPRTGEIRLAAFLRCGPPETLHEVLCHESAHAAVYALHGARPKPHGAEWRSLMQAAGYVPRARLPAAALPEALRVHVQREPLWRYHCPVCLASRDARRRMARWRCASCRAAGHAGRLVATRLRWGAPAGIVD